MTQETTTKHDSSPPRGDRAELDTAPVEPQERRIVLRMANGSFFRGFRPRGRGGGAVSVQRLGQARLFAPASRALEQARSKGGSVWMLSRKR